MEPLLDRRDPASDPHAFTPRDYVPRRSRWPGLIGAAAIVVAVLGVTMWAQHDDARKAEAPLDKGARVTAPVQPGSDFPTAAPSTQEGNAGIAASDESKVATQPPPARQ